MYYIKHLFFYCFMAYSLLGMANSTIFSDDSHIADITIDCPPTVEANTDPTTCFASNVDLGMPVVATTCGLSNLENDAPDNFPLGMTVVTWTATDNNDFSTSCMQTVNVTDNTPPTLNCPSVFNTNVNQGQCGAQINLGIIAGEDNCPGVMTTLTSTLGNGSFFPVGSTMVSYKATDAAGLETDCSFMVNVRDNEKPILNCNEITVLLQSANTYILTAQDKATMISGSTDNCTSVNDLVVIVDKTDFDCSDIGEHLLNVMVQDLNNNFSAPCMIPLTVVAPTGQLTLSTTATSLVEGDGGIKNVTFIVSRDETTCPAQVDYTTMDGTATAANNDYTAKSGQLNFAAGESSKTITIQVNADNLVEDDEVFKVVFSNANNNLVIVDDQLVITILTDDFANNALDFDGVNDEVSIDDFIMPLSFTIEFWIYYEGQQNSTEAVIAYQGNYLFLGFDQGRLKLFGTSVGMENAFPTDDNWKHIAMTYNGVTKFIELYVDGSRVDFQQKNDYGPFNMDRNDADNRLGLGSGLPGANSILDDFRLWSSVRSAEEIMEKKDCKLNGTEENLVVYYTFDEATPASDNRSLTTLPNRAGNDFDGTLHGFALTGSISNFVLNAPTLEEFCPGSLAVDWLNFTAQTTDSPQRNQIVSLTWEVSSAVQVSHYIVERSTDGKNFFPIAKVAATNESLYHSLDPLPSQGNNFYQIREVATDRRSSLSETKLVIIKSNTSIELFPNPTNDVVHIRTSKGIVNLTVFDSVGRIIHQSKLEKVDLANQPSGLYFIKIETENGQYLEQIVKH